MERLQHIQEEVGAWATENFGLARPSYRPLLGAGEELGQLFRAHLKWEQGIKGMDEDKYHKEARDALGDIVIYLLDYCDIVGLSLEMALAITWEEVQKRDWKKFPETGKNDNKA